MLSLTGVGAIVTIVELVLHMLGITVPEGTVSAAINGFVSILGLVALVWGQVRRPDLKYGLIRKQ